MCMHMGYPSAHGYIFADLQAGDEILVKAGAGHPQQENDATEIIVDVDGMSALTANGIKLMCTDGVLIKPTGNHFEPGTFSVSPEAERILIAHNRMEI